MRSKNKQIVKNEFYDWQKTLSFDADITIAISNRDAGKTFGLRMQCINDWIEHKWRFVVICRWANELPIVMSGYFDKVRAQIKKFQDYEFKTNSAKGFIRKKGDKKWHIICYFVAFTQRQSIKQATFVNVKRLVMDEAILERMDYNHKYLSDEWELLASAIDSCARETGAKGVKELKPKVYLLGNAVDIVNPWFEHLHITSEPPIGYTWYKQDGVKTVLLDYRYNKHFEERKKKTLVGRMLSGSRSGKEATENKFDINGVESIGQKPNTATFLCAIKYNDYIYGIWTDEYNGYYYINHKYPNKSQIYSLSLRDTGLNMLILKRTNPILKNLFDAIRLNLVKFDTLQTYNTFLRMLDLLGYK